LRCHLRYTMEQGTPHKYQRHIAYWPSWRFPLCAPQRLCHHWRALPSAPARLASSKWRPRGAPASRPAEYSSTARARLPLRASAFPASRSSVACPQRSPTVKTRALFFTLLHLPLFSLHRLHRLHRLQRCAWAAARGAMLPRHAFSSASGSSRAVKARSASASLAGVLTWLSASSLPACPLASSTRLGPLPHRPADAAAGHSHLTAQYLPCPRLTCT